MAKNTYDTGYFMLMNIGTRPRPPKNGMITAICYKIGDEVPAYASEGSITVTGPPVQWLRDNLRTINSIPKYDTLTESVQNNSGIYFVPVLSGSFAPY